MTKGCQAGLRGARKVRGVQERVTCKSIGRPEGGGGVRGNGGWGRAIVAISAGHYMCRGGGSSALGRTTEVPQT